MLDLCLINPPHPQLVTPGAQAPIGLLYVAGAAEAAGLSVQIVDLAAAEMDARCWRFPEARVYGITATYLDIEAVGLLARKIKRWHGSGKRVIVGGPISLSPERVRINIVDGVDTLVRGEAESSIVQIVTEDVGPSFEGKPADVNAIPRPARGLWPGKLGGKIFWQADYFPNGSTTIVSSRGCPWNCAFCAGRSLPGARTVRLRDPADVVAEMEQVVCDHHIREFRFCDEFMTANRRHITALCNHIRMSVLLGHGEAAVWRASVAVKPNDIELWRQMYAAGCREVSFGVESMDQAVLDTLNCKKGTVEDARKALANARKAGLVARALLMIGTPGETRETAVRNIEFLTRGDYDVAALAIFTPIPGCAVAAKPARFGCAIREGALDAGLCLYGPDGRNPIAPTIEVQGLSTEELRHQMRIQADVAEAVAKVGRG